MATWEYCEIANPGSGDDHLLYSNQQGDGIIDTWSQRLQRGLKAEQSKPQRLVLNLNHTSPILIAGWLGTDGWELVSHATLTGGHEYFVFKRPTG